ncbi:MscS family membrane protein [Chromatocurvus halotolerans]|uniref:MscS family membrane protein n=2 Tax=Chromatocurvus halotolerans TaxID=1132028 RepID=A0A4R2KW56_9GAMM|nr:MscS family membrane protein [Chromatocurvus halotolerans]
MEWSMASLLEFWDLVREVWNQGVYGINLPQILAALVIILFSLMVRSLFTRYVLGALTRLSHRSATSLDNSVIQALREPLRFVPVLLGIFLASRVMHLSDSAEAFVYNINRSLVAFTLFWAFFCISTPVGNALTRSSRLLTEAMGEWLVKFARLVFVTMGAATILELWGVAVAPIIAGFGLFGVAVALGAQDLFKNLIAGLFVLGERRFETGDWIQVDGVVEGTVLQIGFRTTTIRRFDRAPVYVPNARLADNAVTNFSRMSHRRIRWMLGVEYRTTLEQLREIRDGIERYILESDEFARPDEVATFVRIDSFNDSSIDILLYCFTHTTVWGEWLEIKERLACRIKEIVEAAGTGFAFPSRSLYLENTGEVAEVFPLSPGQDDGATPAGGVAATPVR